MVDEINSEPDLDVESVKEDEVQEMKVGDFEGQTYLKNPDVGNIIEFVVNKVVKNPNTEGKNNETGKIFSVGLKDKNDKVTRYDIYTDKGVYTVNSWEVYFKLFDGRANTEGILIKYARGNNKSFAGAKISIKRLFDGSHASRDVKELAKLKDITEEQAKKYKKEVEEAMKERRLYEVKSI